MLAGCSLDETPYGFYSQDNFYQTEADAESGLMYAYNALNYLEYLRGIWYLGDIPTETMYPKSSEPGDIHMLQDWTVTPETELTLYYFKYCYIGINRANTVIRRVTDSNLDDAVKRKVTGEAYFLRAWNYFNLVRGYGRVPLYTEPISTLDMTTPEMAESIEQIYGQIISDLTLAEQQLEVNKVFGRVDKVAAQALLAKVYLNMASGKHYGAPGYTDFSIDADATYELAASWAKKVVNDYKQYYDFDDDLLHIYDVNYPDGPEHIFIMATDRSGTDEGMYTKIPLQFLPNNGSVPLYIKYGDGTLKRGNGNGWGVFIIEDEFMNTMFDPTDKRRTELMHHTFYDENGEEINVAENNGYYSAKYVDPDFIGERTSARPYLIRYSDIALVLAEAEGPTTEAYQLVNHIRQRAGIGDLTPGLPIEEFREEVIKERARELAFEGNRLYDLRRTASVTKTVQEATKLSEEDAAFYPIPQRELDLNPNVR